MTRSNRHPLPTVAHYLAAGEVGDLHPCQRAQLDRVRRLLCGQEVWSSPPPELVDVVVDRVSRDVAQR